MELLARKVAIGGVAVPLWVLLALALGAALLALLIVAGDGGGGAFHGEGDVS